MVSGCQRERSEPLALLKITFSARITGIQQKYENSNALHLGEITMEQDGCQIKIYNKERMLLELIRNKNSFPFDYYKEILNNYRQIIHTLNIQDIQDYADALPKSKMIMETLRLEVF